VESGSNRTLAILMAVMRVVMLVVRMQEPVLIHLLS